MRVLEYHWILPPAATYQRSSATSRRRAELRNSRQTSRNGGWKMACDVLNRSVGGSYSQWRATTRFDFGWISTGCFYLHPRPRSRVYHDLERAPITRQRLRWVKHPCTEETVDTSGIAVEGRPFDGSSYVLPNGPTALAGRSCLSRVGGSLRQAASPIDPYPSSLPEDPSTRGW